MKFWKTPFLQNTWRLLLLEVPFACNMNFRSSHQSCSVRKGVLRNFGKFTGKHLCQSLIFNKAADLGPATLSKRGSCTDVFLWILQHFYREGYTVEFFFQGISWNTVSGSLHEAWNTFMNTFTLVFQFHCVRFLSIKKLCLQLEMYRVKFNSIKKYLWLIKQKQNNSKIPKHIWMKPCSKTRGSKSACANIFLEPPLTI